MSGLKVFHTNPYASDIDVPCVEYSDDDVVSSSRPQPVRLPITNAAMGAIASTSGTDNLMRRSSMHRRHSHRSSTGQTLTVPGRTTKVVSKPSPVLPSPQSGSTKATPSLQKPTIVQQQPLAQNASFQQPQQEGQFSKLWKSLGSLPDKALTYFANGLPVTTQPEPNPQAVQPQHVTGQPGPNTYIPPPVQQPFKPIPNQPAPSQPNQFLQPPGSFPQQPSPLPYPANQGMYQPPGNGLNMAHPLPYYGYQQPAMQAPTTSFYNPGFTSMLSSVPQPSPYKKMAKSYKRKDKKGIFPAGVDLSDSDSDYEFRESVAAKANNGQGNYLVAGLIGVIAIALFLLTRSSGNPVTTTVAPAERNIARDFIENSINTAPPVQQAPVVVSSPPVITPTTDVFEQLASVLRTIIFITIAGVAVYCYYISNSQGNLPGKVQGNFFSNKQNSQSTNQPFSKKERPGPLLPQLNWWEMFQPAAYPPSRLGNFGAALGGGLGGVVQGYMGLGQGQAMPGQPFFNRGYPYPNMANHRMPVHVNMHYDADDDEEYDSDDSDEDSDEGKVAYQEYLPAGMFDYRKEPNYFLNEKAKAQAREKAIAALSGKPAGAADTAEKKVVYSKSDLPEEFKPHYEPMPPVPGIDDPDPPISDTLVKNGPDKEKLQEVTERKTLKNGETKGILKKDSEKERIKGLKKDNQEYFMDEYSCKPYGPPPKRYHGVSSGETPSAKAVAT